MKTKAMLLNDLEFAHEKEIVRQRVEMYKGFVLASDIFVWPDYPIGWHATFGIFNENVGDYEAVRLHCVWGRLDWEIDKKLHGFLPSGAVIVDCKPRYTT